MSVFGRSFKILAGDDESTTVIKEIKHQAKSPLNTGEEIKEEDNEEESK